MTKPSLLTALSQRDAAHAALLGADFEIAQRGVVPESWRERRRTLYQEWRRCVEEYKRQYVRAQKGA